VRAFWEKTSPYANLRKNVAYPQPFIFTTTKDDRVGPQHARKFAARMEEMGLPFYFYENTEGGHAAGANLRQTARTNALEMVYLTRKLMDPVEPGAAK
jgi:prolyl oligopeptidase